MLTRWHLFLAWMLLAALPLQGFAASTMLLCAGHTHRAAGAAAPEEAGHDHATHRHAAADATQQHAHAASATDAQHQCNLCASCCHTVGIAEPPALAATAGVPLADLPDPVVPDASHLSRLPDRPPRA